ncbi:hypothetical protein B0H13DRAFT_1857261 [Mycena leptocephala]|nr:hypothetical protein B0H13DRAFT_1857261 [Mycena leptocephala]
MFVQRSAFFFQDEFAAAEALPPSASHHARSVPGLARAVWWRRSRPPSARIVTRSLFKLVSAQEFRGDLKSDWHSATESSHTPSRPTRAADQEVCISLPVDTGGGGGGLPLGTGGTRGHGRSGGGQTAGSLRGNESSRQFVVLTAEKSKKGGLIAGTLRSCTDGAISLGAFVGTAPSTGMLIQEWKINVEWCGEIFDDEMGWGWREGGTRGETYWPRNRAKLGDLPRREGVPHGRGSPGLKSTVLWDGLGYFSPRGLAETPQVESGRQGGETRELHRCSDFFSRDEAIPKAYMSDMCNNDLSG